MADVYGRLTGRAGVCLGTLDPVRSTSSPRSQMPSYRRCRSAHRPGRPRAMHKESHQYIDLLRVMRPITKWNAWLSDAAIIPEVVRKASRSPRPRSPAQPTSSCPRT